MSVPPSPNHKLTWAEKGKLFVSLSCLTRLSSNKASSKNIELLFDIDNSHQQESAHSSLIEMGLDSASQNALESRWTTQYSVKWGHGTQEQKRTLFQCACGYHVQARQQRESNKGMNCKTENWERWVPYPFTACLAHVEVTEQVRDQVISRIASIVEHNSQCHAAVLERLPPIPLHNHVYEVALEQLRNGASLTAIQETNRKMLEAKTYQGLDKELGYDPPLQPQYNVDDWLNCKSRSFRPEIAAAVFHYSAQADAGDQFEICISTPEMDDCACKYAHHSQLVLDGTFGVCSSRLLLFIALTVDEDNKGIPVALFLFSAETGAKATHASYNSAILEKLIRTWKLRLETKFGSFEPYSAITNTDTKEHGALVRIWPQIILLICKFHLRQCWTNHRKKSLRCKAPEFWKNHVRTVLQKLEVDLLATVDYSIATNILVNHKHFFDTLILNPEAKRASEAGLEHVKYLQNYWMSRSLWESWSECGRLAAAARIGIPIEGIIPTTNHLESFNAVLKRKYVARYLRSGHRLRFDALILLLIYHRHLLVLQQTYHENEKESARLRRCICWWPLDEERNQRARLHSISWTGSSEVVTYVARCNPSGSGPTPYRVSISSSGIALCTCTDFYNNGKACKHMRALRIVIDSWIAEGHISSAFYYPATFEKAQNIQQAAKTPLPAPSSANSITAAPAEDFLEADWAMLQAIAAGANDTDDASVSLDRSYAGVGVGEGFSPQEGITAQITHRLAQEVRFLLPRLYGVENALSDLDTCPTSLELTEFQQVIESLASCLLTLQKCSPSNPSVQVPNITSTGNALAGNLSAGKQSRSKLCAPSPEAKQQRKISNSTI
ncbi:hypothetical protein EV359DRAFT_75017 [Lentinula novae-zelandiae]|nr:hypothetical protein EV359DRAFT_75017 [Lentinula novae-zelandiae]